MTGYVDLWFIVWLHNIIARIIVAHICDPLFACVSNPIVTELPLTFRWVLQTIWLLVTSQMHDANFFFSWPHKDFFLRFVECPWPQDFTFWTRLE